MSLIIDDTSLQGIYKLSHSWVIVWTTVQTNNTKCVLKGILIQVAGLKIVKTCTFNVPHTCSTAPISIIHPFCDGVAFLKAGLPSLRMIQLFIPILALVQWSIWGLLSLSGPRNGLPMAARFTLLKLSNSLSTSSTNRAVSWRLLNTPTKNTNTWAVPSLFHCHSSPIWKIYLKQDIKLH